MKWTTSWARAASNVVVGEGQVLGRWPAHLTPGLRAARRPDERRRGVDGRHRLRPEPRHQLGRQGARAAADVEDPLAGAHAREFGHLRESWVE